MRFVRVGAGDKGIQPLDSMGKSVPGQEFQRPVGDRRLGAEPVRAQTVEDLVGAKGPVFLQQVFEHPAPLWRELQAVSPAMGIGLSDGVRHATGVVVRTEPDGGRQDACPGRILRLICYSIHISKRRM